MGAGINPQSMAPNMAENSWEWEDKDGICVMGRGEEHG